MQSKVDCSSRNQLMINKSLRNCHVEGLHSILFHEEKGLFTRMFVATQNHTLYPNHFNGNEKNWDLLTLAVHPHRVDIQIHVVSGVMWNMEFEKSTRQSEAICTTLKPFKWNSHIMRNGKDGGFEAAENSYVRIKNKRKLCEGDQLKMRSDQLHSVFIDKGETASWFIYESTATGGYDGITYSNNDLSSWSAEELYKKATQKDLKNWLSIAKLQTDL